MIETYDGDALDVSALMTAVADLLRRQLCDPTAYAAALPDSMLANRHRGIGTLAGRRAVYDLVTVRAGGY
jgi:hypothetical protein